MRLATTLILAAATLAAACTSDARSTTMPTSPTSPGAASVASIEISGIAPTSAAFQLTATARFSNGTTQDVTRSATWQSTNTAVASVSSAGLVTVIANGDVDFRATYQNVTGTAHATLNMASSATLSGSVTDAAAPGAPIASARVQILGGDHVFTDDRGAFSMPSLRTGRLLVEVTKDGYQPLEREILLDRDVHLTFVLTKSAQ